MGTVIEFPVEPAARRLGAGQDGLPSEGLGTLLILPVVRIERLIEAPIDDGTTGGNGPEQGSSTSGGRRRRRARS